MSNSAIPWTAACQASLSITNSRSLLKLMSIESVIPSNISFSVVLFSSLLQSLPASRTFSVSEFFTSSDQNIGASASAISPSDEYSRLISFRMDRLDLLAVQETLKSLLQHQVQKHQFFDAQLSLWSNSHIYTCLLKKAIALTIWTFVSKVMSLLFNMLSRLVIAFLPKSKRFLISWLQ